MIELLNGLRDELVFSRVERFTVVPGQLAKVLIGRLSLCCVCIHDGSGRKSAPFACQQDSRAVWPKLGFRGFSSFPAPRRTDLGCDWITSIPARAEFAGKTAVRIGRRSRARLGRCEMVDVAARAMVRPKYTPFPRPSGFRRQESKAEIAICATAPWFRLSEPSAVPA